MAMPNPLSDYRRRAIQAAKDLYYGDHVINLVKKARSIDEIAKIMNSARHNYYKESVPMSVAEYDKMLDKEML